MTYLYLHIKKDLFDEHFLSCYSIRIRNSGPNDEYREIPS